VHAAFGAGQRRQRSLGGFPRERSQGGAPLSACSKSSCTIKVHARRLRSGASCPCGQTAPSLSPALWFLRYGRHRNRRTQETLERIRFPGYFYKCSGFCTAPAPDLIPGTATGPLPRLASVVFSLRLEP